MPHTLGERFGDIEYCYLTTTGRISSEPRTIEIWFALAGYTLYMLAGGREQANWVRNLRKTPSVRVRLDDETFAGRARVLLASSDEDALARRLLLDKYTARYSGDLTSWAQSALPVAVDLEPAPH